MAVPASTVPTVKKALFNNITALVNDPTVLVVYDDPGVYQPDDIISVGRVERQVTTAHMVGSGGAKWLREEYTIFVVVSVFRGGDDPQTADARAYTLLAFVESAARNDPSMNSAVIVARPIASHTVGSWDDDHKGRLVEITVEIFVIADI